MSVLFRAAARLATRAPSASALAPRAAMLRISAVRCAEGDVPSAPGAMTLNFTLPTESLYESANVEMVILPGGDGMFGVMPNHVPTVSELKPGVVSVQEEVGGPLLRYFISGGFASSEHLSRTHPVPSTLRMCALRRLAYHCRRHARMCFPPAQ